MLLREELQEHRPHPRVIPIGERLKELPVRDSRVVEGLCVGGAGVRQRHQRLTEGARPGQRSDESGLLQALSHHEYFLKKNYFEYS